MVEVANNNWSESGAHEEMICTDDGFECLKDTDDILRATRKVDL